MIPLTMSPLQLCSWVSVYSVPSQGSINKGPIKGSTPVRIPTHESFPSLSTLPRGPDPFGAHRRIPSNTTPAYPTPHCPYPRWLSLMIRPCLWRSQDGRRKHSRLREPSRQAPAPARLTPPRLTPPPPSRARRPSPDLPSPRRNVLTLRRDP